MRPGKLYLKIFLSFVGVLLVTEILIFGFFMVTVGRVVRDRFDHYTRAKVLVAREFLRDKIAARPDVPLARNEAFKEALLFLDRTYGIRIWITGPGGEVLVQSFQGPPPELSGVSSRRLAGGSGQTEVYYQRDRRRHHFEATASLELAPDRPATLHVNYAEEEPSHPGLAFGLGLAIIGAVVALLIIPVSRLITRPINQLKESALRLADGDLAHRVDLKTGDEIGELGRSFNHMADRLEQIIKGGRELTANVSHQLRSPLARIRLAEELLRERLAQSGDERLLSHLEDIGEDVAELDRILGRILELSKLDIHETPLDLEALDPGQLLEELLRRFEPAMKGRRLTLLTHLRPGPPVRGDGSALRTALANVLDNALRYTPEGGRVIVRAGPGEGGYLLSVTNTFEALSQEDLTRAFEPFFRPRSSPAAGSGLGLAITRKIIDRHGGDVAASNTEEGFRISIRLPAGPGQA